MTVRQDPCKLHLWNDKSTRVAWCANKNELTSLSLRSHPRRAKQRSWLNRKVDSLDHRDTEDEELEGAIPSILALSSARNRIRRLGAWLRKRYSPSPDFAPTVKCQPCFLSRSSV